MSDFARNLKRLRKSTGYTLEELILAGDDLVAKRALVHGLIDKIELIDEDVVIHLAFV